MNQFKCFFATSIGVWLALYVCPCFGDMTYSVSGTLPCTNDCVGDISFDIVLSHSPIVVPGGLFDQGVTEGLTAPIIRVFQSVPEPGAAYLIAIPLVLFGVCKEFYGRFVASHGASQLHEIDKF